MATVGGQTNSRQRKSKKRAGERLRRADLWSTQSYRIPVHTNTSRTRPFYLRLTKVLWIVPPRTGWMRLKTASSMSAGTVGTGTLTSVSGNYTFCFTMLRAQRGVNGNFAEFRRILYLLSCFSEILTLKSSGRGPT